jgi:hypothetical protein
MNFKFIFDNKIWLPPHEAHHEPLLASEKHVRNRLRQTSILFALTMHSEGARPAQGGILIHQSKVRRDCTHEFLGQPLPLSPFVIAIVERVIGRNSHQKSGQRLGRIEVKGVDECMLSWCVLFCIWCAQVDLPSLRKKKNRCQLCESLRDRLRGRRGDAKP